MLQLLTISNLSGKIITYYGMITRIGIIIMDIATINDVHVHIQVLRVALKDKRATEDSRYCLNFLASLIVRSKGWKQLRKSRRLERIGGHIELMVWWKLMMIDSRSFRSVL